jgi:hypothetical protein
MSQLDVNIIAPLGYTGPNLPGNNNFVQIVDNTGDTIFKSPGSNNLAIGSDTMSAIAGSGNIALGNSALKDTSFGDFNIAIGLESMKTNINGVSNIAIGLQALGGTTVSPATMGNDANIAIGNSSLIQIVQAASNVAVGVNAGYNATDATLNTLLGSDAGITTTTGSNNVCLGYNARTATPTTNNSVTLGNSSISVIRAAVTTITSLSDERDKKEIQDLPVGLEFLEKLKPVKFVWNDRDEDGKHDIEDFGFIAQDLKAAQEESEASYLNLVYDENPEKLEASYGKLLPVLVKAIQEMSSEIKLLKEEILTLKTK